MGKQMLNFGNRQMRSCPPIVEQLSQLFLNNWDNCSTLVYSHLPLVLPAKYFGSH